MKYRQLGNTGIKVSEVGFGAWQLGNARDWEGMEDKQAIRLVHEALDQGCNFFDTAPNYGGGKSESLLGDAFSGRRSEVVINSKFGHHPDNTLNFDLEKIRGSVEDSLRRLKTDYLDSILLHNPPFEILTGVTDHFVVLESLKKEGKIRAYGASVDSAIEMDELIRNTEDQSLKRMGLDYVDIFYHHRPDPETPLEETMMALDQVVRQGKALYVGLSNYGVEETKQAITILKELGTPLLIHQPAYSMFNRWVEDGLTDLLQEEGVGSIAFVPLAQGLLTNRYLNGIPEDSRALKPNSFLNEGDVSEEVLTKVRQLNEIAQERGQSLAQMALAWVLREQKITSALIGASKVSQIEENVAALNRLDFSETELNMINDILK